MKLTGIKTMFFEVIPSLRVSIFSGGPVIITPHWLNSEAYLRLG